MSHWTLEDGTIIHIGGRVEGKSAAADALRDDAQAPGAVYVGTAPDGIWKRPDLSDELECSCWLASVAYRMNLRIVAGPGVGEPAEDPGDPGLDIIY